jgi:hypothetical protein
MQDMDQMVTRSTYQQPTLTQMDFGMKPAPKGRSIPSGWQCTVDHATRDPFYGKAASGRVVYKFDNMFKQLVKKTAKISKAVTPIPPYSLLSPFLKRPFQIGPSSLSHVYLTPPWFEDSTLSQPIQLDEDELSEALSDLTNTQLPPKRQQKRRKRVFAVKSQGAIVGEEHWETNNDTVASPNLLED